MKVILLEDVKALGKQGEVVNVSDGYARNFILPKKLGLEANQKNMNELKLKKAHEEKVAEKRYEEALALAARLGEGEVVLKIKTGEGGKLFGSVSTKEIAAGAAAQLGLELDKKKIQISEPIKSLGVHTVSVKLHPKVAAQLAVRVEEA